MDGEPKSGILESIGTGPIMQSRTGIPTYTALQESNRLLFFCRYRIKKGSRVGILATEVEVTWTV